MLKVIRNVDEHTGEVLSEKQKKYHIFDEDKGYLFKANAYQKRMYSDIKLSDYIKDRMDLLRTYILSENIYKDTNTLMVRVNTRLVRIATIEDIAKMITLSPKKTKEFLNRMKKLHIIAERIDKIGELIQVKYLLNPLFFNSKKYISADLYFLFQSSLDCYLPDWVIKRFHEVGNMKIEEEVKEIKE